MSDLRELVADTMWRELAYATERYEYDNAAPAVIAVVIEALAAEADDPQVRMAKHLGWTTTDWLRSFLDAGRDGEAG